MAMTRDDVIRMAKEAGIPVERAQFSLGDDFVGPHGMSQLQRFADLIAKAEREACAKACESYEEHIETFRDSEYQGELAGRQAGAARCAAAIREWGGK